MVKVHARDVFEDLVKKKIKDIEDFEWSKQARFYWRDDLDVAKVHVADVDFSYCNEYLGVKERLVITPLTDRCYITLSQALGFCLGGAPAGPAGTGKTETTKDMGCTLGKLVLVTNCGDQMDYRSTGRIIKGLAQAGVWGCFDEFNRINLEVLSVVAQQVGSVFDAIKADKENFQFTDGQVINLNKEVGYFITMNPGYAGRQELPENLKSLFRGVTMMVPDRQIIMQVKLTGAGYKQNAILGKKFNVLYALCEQQLSKQAHYDFGLRNILAVLRTAGSSKRDDLSASEHMLLMRTLRDMNLSKFVAEDVPLFLSLIEDLFPGLRAAPMTHKAVQASLDKRIPELNLQPLPSWVLKVIQTYEMSLVRHSLMLVGPSGTGKSRIVEVLHKTLEACAISDTEPPMVGQSHKEMRMNPKAITAPQMFGFLDIISNEWTEGIFASIWRKANKDKKHFTWIVLDGPVDAIWIENMNTVMDDNRWVPGSSLSLSLLPPPHPLAPPPIPCAALPSHHLSRLTSSLCSAHAPPAFSPSPTTTASPCSGPIAPFTLRSRTCATPRPRLSRALASSTCPSPTWAGFQWCSRGSRRPSGQQTRPSTSRCSSTRSSRPSLSSCSSSARR